ncbi:hypothetical protein Tco_0487771 [Tanacetum coccineum]
MRGDVTKSQTGYVFIVNGGASLSRLMNWSHEKGARHFLRRYHYVRDTVDTGEIKLIKVHTDKNLADAVSKALLEKRFK